MLRTLSGLKIRLDKIGAQGLHIEIDHWPNSNSFQRTVDVLVTTPPPGEQGLSNVLSVTNAVGISYEEAAQVYVALGAGLTLMPALQACVSTARARIDKAVGIQAYHALCDQQLKVICEFAGLEIVE